MNLPMADRQGRTGAFAKRVSEYELVRDFLRLDPVARGRHRIRFLFLDDHVARRRLVMVPIVGIAIMLIAGFSLQKWMGRALADAQADSSLAAFGAGGSIAGAGKR